MFFTIAQAIGASRSLKAQPMRSSILVSVERSIPLNAGAGELFRKEDLLTDGRGRRAQPPRR
jgi:hypothetical protein